MNIFSGVMKLSLLVFLLSLVATVIGGYDAKFQKRAASGGLGKTGMRLHDRERSHNPILRRYNQNMQEYDNDDYDTSNDRGDPENGDEDDGEGNNEPGKCGLRFVDNGDYLSNADRIVGGDVAARGEFPWQVSIDRLVSRGPYKTERGYYCGAVIISEFWILSAGHCFIGAKTSDYLLTVGNHHLARKDDGEQEFEVEQMIVHEKYNPDVNIADYDIALLKIKPSANGQGIKFNKYVQPVCLPDASTSFPEGTHCVVAGWGRTSAGGPISEVLLKTYSPITNQARCKELYAPLDDIAVTERTICSGNVNGGNGACNGDSGGGLVCKTGDVYTLAGIVSGGKPCALPEYVTVFSLVPKFIPWIRSNVQRNSNFAQSMLPTSV